MRYDPKRHRLPPFTASGILLVDKPQEWTSFDVVNFVRARFNVPKVGHCGTLDPAATGLLVLMLGKFTQLSQKFSGDDKIYEATLLLGKTTDTEDMDGVETSRCDTTGLTAEVIRQAVLSFRGPQMQVPPMVSAVKKDGKKLYELARQGVEVEREPREITIHELDITRLENPECDFTVRCSKGTYVRTLCADMGKKLGVGGVLKKLRRLRSGEFSIDDALTIDKLKTMEQPDLAILLREFMFEKLSKSKRFS